MDNEYLFITETLLPSLLRAAEKITGVKKIAPSVGPLEEPAVLVFLEDRMFLISCTIYAEGTDVYYYCVEEPGEWKLEFPSLYLPEELPFFPDLPALYDRILFGEPVPVSDERNDAERRFTEMFELTRLPALREVLTELGLDCAQVQDEEGRSALVAMEDEEFIRFSYDYTMPELRLTVLIVKTPEVEILIPEYGNISPVSDYEKLLGTIG